MEAVKSETHIETREPQRYIKRLCKHFAHKIEATYAELYEPRTSRFPLRPGVYPTTTPEESRTGMSASR